jgi:hypothetical protein
LALTSSITNRFSRALGGALLLLLACSSPPPRKSADEAALELTEELDSLSRKVQQVNFGPTLRDGGVFQDRTADYGLENLTAVAFNAVDLNGDGHTDLVVLPTYYSRPKFFLFDPAAKKFVPWSHDPLPPDFKASFLLFYDLNKDRVIDLVSGVLNQRTEVSKIPVKFYRGSRKEGLLTFTEDPKALNLPAEPTSSVTLVDFDLDGWVDIFISNWFENRDKQYFPVSDRLLRNNRGVFEEASNLLRGESGKAPDQLFPPNAKPTYGASSCDVDQNGYPDILTVSSSGHKNKLWMNLMDPATGERYFDDLGPVTNYASDPDGNLIPTGGGRTFFSACTDYNDDGIMDVFLGELSHAYDNESVDKSSVLTGSRETFPPYFLRTEYVSDANSEAWNQGDRRGAWVDYNIDGRVDLLVDNSGFPPYSRLVLFEQDEGRAFLNVAPQAGIDLVNPTGTIVLDLNRDGLPDIITAQNNIRKAEITPRIYVFENKLRRSISNRSIRVFPQGVQSNTEALGAMVMLYSQSPARKSVQRRWVEYTQGGLPSQNEAGVHFGVPLGFEAVGIKVRWPFVRRSGVRAGVVTEKLYSLKGFPEQSYLEVTVCEDGKILPGRVSCASGSL